LKEKLEDIKRSNQNL